MKTITLDGVEYELVPMGTPPATEKHPIGEVRGIYTTNFVAEVQSDNGEKWYGFNIEYGQDSNWLDNEDFASEVLGGKKEEDPDIVQVKHNGHYEELIAALQECKNRGWI